MSDKEEVISAEIHITTKDKDSIQIGALIAEIKSFVENLESSGIKVDFDFKIKNKNKEDEDYNNPFSQIGGGILTPSPIPATRTTGFGTSNSGYTTNVGSFSTTGTDRLNYYSRNKKKNKTSLLSKLPKIKLKTKTEKK